MAIAKTVTGMYYGQDEDSITEDQDELIIRKSVRGVRSGKH